MSPDMPSLTRVQKRVLAFLVSFIAKREYPPSLVEISKHFSWASKNAAYEHLVTLEEKGFIKRGDKTSRSIRILKQSKQILKRSKR